MDLARVRQRMREMIATGELPCEDSERLFAGKGDGKRCDGCALPIAPQDVEYEVALTSGRTILLHLTCHMIWLEECEPDTTSFEQAPATS